MVWSRARRGRRVGLDQLDRPGRRGRPGRQPTSTSQNYLGTVRVLGFTMIVAVVDVILLTAIATLGAFLYNMAAALLGGIEVTLAEDQH